LTRSALAVRHAPRVRTAPRARSLDDVADAVDLASRYGLTPDDWQEDVLEDWLGRQSSGRWAAATCGLAVARQNGKNGAIEMRELFGMVLLGEKFLHTAHEVKTARKAFLRISSFFENERQYPELAGLAREIRKTNGQEAVVLTNGGSVEFIARSKGSGRGFTVDVLVCDEAQELTDEELAALLPTISAAPTRNPQVILTGTPPDPDRMDKPQGEVFRRVRRDGEKRTDKHLAWTDFGVPDGSLPDVDNRDLWLSSNPALGTRLSIAEVEREHGLMVATTFARERLGWWGDPTGASYTILPGWPGLATDHPGSSVTAIGLAVSVGGDCGSIAQADIYGDDLLNVDAQARHPGSAWMVTEAKRIQTAHDCAVVVDEKCPDGTLIPALEAAGVRVTVMKLADYIEAWSDLVNRVRESTVTHQAAAELDNAVASASLRSVGDGRKVPGRKASSGDIDMLEAAVAAICGARSGASVYEDRGALVL
jgi:phage terminase large subunit-like protein